MARMVAMLLLVGSSIALVQAQPACRTYRRLFTSSDGSAVMDTIDVPDSFPVASVSVSGINVAHTRVGALQVSLLHQAPGASAPTAVVLKPGRAGSTGANLADTGFSDSAAAAFPTAESAPFTGTFTPAQPLSTFAGQEASGPWAIRIADITTGGVAQPITLTGWSLTICPSTEPSTAALQGPSAADADAPWVPTSNAALQGSSAAAVDAPLAPTPAPLPAPAAPVPAPAPEAPAVSVSLNSSGLNVTVGNGTSGFRLGIGGGSEGSDVRSFGDIALDLLFPFRPQVDPQVQSTSGASWTAGPVLTAAGMAKDAAHAAVENHVDDVLQYIKAKSDIMKDYVNKKISDYINTVNSASAMTQQLIKGGGADLGSHALIMHRQAGDLKTAIGGLKGAAKQELQDKVEYLFALTSKFTSASSAIIGDMSSTGSLMKDLVAAKVKAVTDAYTTTEGLVKAHIDTSVQRRVSALNALLEHIISAADAAAANPMSGPVIDFKLHATQVKLQVLEAALDKVAAAVQAMPTPSQAIQNKLEVASALIGSHPFLKSMSDPEFAMAQLMGNIGKFKDMMTANMG